MLRKNKLERTVDKGEESNMNMITMYSIHVCNSQHTIYFRGVDETLRNGSTLNKHSASLIAYVRLFLTFIENFS